LSALLTIQSQQTVIQNHQKAQGEKLQEIVHSITILQQELDEVKSSCSKHDEELQKIQSNVSNTLSKLPLPKSPSYVIDWLHNLQR